MKAYLFPGQGAQFAGMAKRLLAESPAAKRLAQEADDCLGFGLSKIMTEGTEEDLRQTHITQPAIFVHSMMVAAVAQLRPLPDDVVAGHSLGEFSALCFAGALSFSEALTLVHRRALAMQAACEASSGTMAAAMSLDNALVERVCASVEDAVVVAANYNNPGQLVISGSLEGIALATERLKAEGCKVLPLKVGGAFHSPLMQPAQDALRTALMQADFKKPICAICQNVTAELSQEVEVLREQLMVQLTAPVRWQQSMEKLLHLGYGTFIEVGGKGQILLGMLKKIDRQAQGLSLDEASALAQVLG